MSGAPPCAPVSAARPWRPSRDGMLDDITALDRCFSQRSSRSLEFGRDADIRRPSSPMDSATAASVAESGSAAGPAPAPPSSSPAPRARSARQSATPLRAVTSMRAARYSAARAMSAAISMEQYLNSLLSKGTSPGALPASVASGTPSMRNERDASCEYGSRNSRIVLLAPGTPSSMPAAAPPAPVVATSARMCPVWYNACTRPMSSVCKSFAASASACHDIVRCVCAAMLRREGVRPQPPPPPPPQQRLDASDAECRC
mmetsp:Transcript_23436/g.73514  ORF Transcript_23436/g.73514 Transcript_23436/m.73514 type:complete len:259 (-) Transcript_23436:415-1191(-)